MRTKGYKCSNINCGSCVGHSLCGEPADTALGCASRMVNMVTNGDRIRAMSDEQLAEGLEEWQDWGGGLSKELWLEWLKQPAKGE